MPAFDDELPLRLQIENAEQDLRIYDALHSALNDPARLMNVFANAADPASALAALGSEFGFDRVQCAAVMDAQFRRVTIGERRKIENTRRELIEQLALLRNSDR